MVRLTASKKATDLNDVIMRLLASKGLDSTLICFCGMDGTNAISGQRKRPTALKPSYHSVYINCNNHQLALCLKHMIPVV